MKRAFIERHLHVIDLDILCGDGTHLVYWLLLLSVKDGAHKEKIIAQRRTRASGIKHRYPKSFTIGPLNPFKIINVKGASPTSKERPRAPQDPKVVAPSIPHDMFGHQNPEICSQNKQHPASRSQRANTYFLIQREPKQRKPNKQICHQKNPKSQSQAQLSRAVARQLPMPKP